MASVGEVDDKDVLHPNDLEELYSWIDVAPLTRPKKHIARDFSDGVSVAEIVHYYLPRMVELHNYVNTNSTAQKRINWNMLNRKVFVKLNLKLNDKTVDNVIDAKPGAIEQVLWDLRRKVIDMNPKTLSKNLSARSTTSTRSNTSTLIRPKTPSPGYFDAKMGRRSPSSITASPSRIPTKAIASFTKPSSASNKATSILPSRRTHTGSVPDKPRDGLSYSAGLKDELTQFDTNVSSNSAPSEAERSQEKPGTQTLPGKVDHNANGNCDSASLPPAHLIYKGHKMVPSMLLDIKNKQIRDLESIVNSLQKKVNFLDNLIQLKDNRVEDLTRQLHSLKSKFQEITQTKFPDNLEY